MSYESDKGYAAEFAVVQYLAPLGTEVRRPRTTRFTETDTGDVHGLPFVVSVKNHAAMDLARWVDEMSAMVRRSPHETGIVVHKRRFKGQAGDWYATTPLGLLMPILWSYVDSRTTIKH